MFSLNICFKSRVWKEIAEIKPLSHGTSWRWPCQRCGHYHGSWGQRVNSTCATWDPRLALGFKQLWGPWARFPQALRQAACLHNVQEPPAFWICTTSIYSCRFGNCLFNHLFACTITQFGHNHIHLHMVILTWAPAKWLHLQTAAGPIYKPLGGRTSLVPREKAGPTGLEVQILNINHMCNGINLFYFKP